MFPLQAGTEKQEGEKTTEKIAVGIFVNRWWESVAFEGTSEDNIRQLFKNIYMGSLIW